MQDTQDCLLKRIAKMHFLSNCYYADLDCFLGMHGCDGIVFCCNTTPHDWAIIIAEKK